MMKKIVLISLLFIFSFSLLFAQKKSATSANRNTAMRCLKLAENCLIGGDWENALKQAELGLSYDEDISDLIYLKAAAEIHLGSTKADVKKLIATAFEKDEWVGYSKTGARILYADLLSDTGNYDESLRILDSDQMIYSADAEFIRIKNLYRMGTESSLNSARLKLNSARRVYSSDSRFPNLFFMFEFINLMENEKLNEYYEVPEIVRTISSFYIKKLPDYSGDKLELELLSSFFAEGEEKNRLIHAIDAKDLTENPIISLAGLNVGLYGEQQAADMFFELSGDVLSLELLEILITKISIEEVKDSILERMLNFNGKIIIDTNFDLQNEVEIEYETGRPKNIKYDFNNDDVIDLYATCDFGLPKFVYSVINNTEIFYDAYPSVAKICYKDSDYVFNFLSGDFDYSLFKLQPDKYLKTLGLDFYIPYYTESDSVFDKIDLVKMVSSIEMPVSERLDGRVLYTMLEGTVVSADFYESSNRYAYCNFSGGFPISRYVDYDDDGHYETIELYDETENQQIMNIVPEDIFGNIFSNSSLYLKKVFIDRNANTFYEFTEQYLENNGKIICWDNNDDGIIDCQYIRYPAEQNNSVTEETIYFDNEGIPEISLTTLDGIPVKMKNKENEIMVYAGKVDNLYWIEEQGNSNMEEDILASINIPLEQGKIVLIELKEVRISVIKVGKSYYCRILPESDIEEEDSEAVEVVE